MAQILKEEVRNSIINAAQDEFLQYGYKDASMRRIAEKSNMTVGNLYRYFENKEAINKVIVAPTLKLIGVLINDLTDNKINIMSDDFNLEVDTNELNNMVSILTDKLCVIYSNHPIGFKILMMQSNINTQIIKWFERLIVYFINKKYQLVNKEREIEILASMYSKAVMAGIKDCFSESKDLEMLNRLLKAFLLSYIAILENDVEKYIGE